MPPKGLLGLGRLEPILFVKPNDLTALQSDMVNVWAFGRANTIPTQTVRSNSFVEINIEFHERFHKMDRLDTPRPFDRTLAFSALPVTSVPYVHVRKGIVATSATDHCRCYCRHLLSVIIIPIVVCTYTHAHIYIYARAGRVSKPYVFAVTWIRNDIPCPWGHVVKRNVIYIRTRAQTHIMLLRVLSAWLKSRRKTVYIFLSVGTTMTITVYGRWECDRKEEPYTHVRTRCVSLGRTTRNTSQGWGNRPSGKFYVKWVNFNWRTRHNISIERDFSCNTWRVDFVLKKNKKTIRSTFQLHFS